MDEARVRQVTDSRVLAVLAHPLRRRLMDVLKVDGPATATGMAARTGQAVANVSHHVRMLQGADLVEEAPELARDARERWWRLTSPALRWSEVDFADDPASAAVAAAAQSINLDRHAGLVRGWNAVADERPEWREAAFSTDRWLRLTPAELQQLSEEMVALLGRWAERPQGDDAEREPVFLFAYGFPAAP
jgi:DNA-binding transcriptional ArsR family regulator